MNEKEVGMVIPLKNTSYSNMTKEQALFLRRLRVEELYSYEAIEKECNKYREEKDWISGEGFCYMAAKILNEDPDASPWSDDN